MYRYVRGCFAVVVSTLFFIGETAAFTDLAGELPHIVTADKSPYLVKADIFVVTGKTVHVQPGTVFLFNNFTGLHVQGVLTVKGTPARPVVFSSSHDRTYSGDTLNPTPYDWNGIHIQKDGMGTVMEHFRVLYSVKGIVSETKFISLTSGIFSENGRSHCTIEGAEQQVTAGKPFSFAVSLKDATVDGVPVKILRDPQAFKRNTVRYSGLTLMAGGMVIGGFFGASYRESQRDLLTLSSRDTSNTCDEDGNERWFAARDKRDRNLAAAVAGAMLAFTGSVGFFWTFTF
ncbi:MAG: hypothetical protein JXA18_08395 [Chitinispirillaceae bacterium]|nr:hypothetical protein [Chitinispirillaceae bacterium]